MVFDINSLIDSLTPLINPVGLGLISSVLYAAWGKWSNTEVFDSRKFLKTLGIGAFLGIIIALTGWAPEQAQSWFVGITSTFGGIFGISKGIGIVSKLKNKLATTATSPVK